MSYAAQSDIEDRLHVEDLRRLCFEGLPEDYETDGEYESARDEAVAERTETALSDASDFMDGHLAARYETPVTPVPGILRTLCADIAIFYLHGLKQGPRGAQWQDRYDAAVKLLSAIRDGSASLPGGVAANMSRTAMFSAAPRFFSRMRTRGF